MIKQTIVFLCVVVVSSVIADCPGKADLIFAIPGSWDIPGEEFFPFETFLTMIVDYFHLSPEQFNIGLILYGKEAIPISYPQPYKDQAQTNTRITLLSQRESYASVLVGKPNLADAMRLMHHMFRNSGAFPITGPRSDAKKIGVVFTYGSVPQNDVNNVVNVATELKDGGITLYAVGRSPVGPEFSQIASDNCKLFSMGSFTKGLPSVLPYLGSSICTYLDNTVNATEQNCFPKFWRPTPNPPVICPSMNEIFQDPYNCAYYYKCDLSVARRERCPTGMLFDNFIRTCNYKDAVTCYSMVTCPQPVGLFPHPTSCTKFLNCFDGIPYVQTCPDHLFFNERTKFCEDFAKVNCRIP